MLITKSFKCYGQYSDYEFLDPVIEYTKDEYSSYEQTDLDPTIETYPIITLTGYEPGEFYHNGIYDKTENIIQILHLLEEQKKRALRVTIKGFADALKNNSFIPTSQLPKPCKKYSRYDVGKEDVQLATVRACNCESILKEIFVNDPSLFYVNLKNEFYDEPDNGRYGPEYRRIEILIDYTSNTL